MRLSRVNERDIYVILLKNHLELSAAQHDCVRSNIAVRRELINEVHHKFLRFGSHNSVAQFVKDNSVDLFDFFRIIIYRHHIDTMLRKAFRHEIFGHGEFSSEEEYAFSPHLFALLGDAVADVD